MRPRRCRDSGVACAVADTQLDDQIPVGLVSVRVSTTSHHVVEIRVVREQIEQRSQDHVLPLARHQPTHREQHSLARKPAFDLGIDSCRALELLEVDPWVDHADAVAFDASVEQHTLREPAVRMDQIGAPQGAYRPSGRRHAT